MRLPLPSSTCARSLFWSTLAAVSLALSTSAESLQSLVHLEHADWEVREVAPG